MERSLYEDRIVFSSINFVFQTSSSLSQNHPEALYNKELGSTAYWLGNAIVMSLKLLKSYCKNRLKENDFSLFTKSNLKKLIEYSDKITDNIESSENPDEEKIAELEETSGVYFEMISEIFEITDLTN